MSPMMSEGRAAQVEEMVGMDGGFVFSELLLQRIWLRGNFLRVGACTMDGRAVDCLHPGVWNRRGGPDFMGARLRIGGVDTRGDVELHLRESDWAAHGHAADPAYGGVVLHVVLFPPREACVTLGVGGTPLPVLALLPLLPFDLEEHALDEAAEALAGRPASEDCAALLGLAPQDCIDILDTHARSRWLAKVFRAAAHLERSGWEEACHRGALEALGNSLNREVMRQVAEAHPLEEWRLGRCDPSIIYMQMAGSWKGGGRPANHPCRRLAQYAAWVQAVPDWPARLLSGGPALASLCGGVGEGEQPGYQTSEAQDELGFRAFASQAGLERGLLRRRRPRGFGALRQELVQELCGGVLSGPRFDSFVCDHCLPLLAARTAECENGFHLTWSLWCPGDVAQAASEGLRRVFAGLLEVQTHCNWLHQGFIGWGLERRRRLNC